MARDLGRLQIHGLIVHDVPQPVRLGDGTLDESPLGLSEIESQLTPRLTNYFCERIVESLGTRSYRVQFDEESNSPLPALVDGCLSPQPADFVATSQAMARHLYRSQDRRSPAGLLAAAQVTVEGLPGLGIIKLEKEGGVRVRGTQVGGKSTFVIELLDDLMLTRHTRVFKVGLFVQAGETVRSIEGSVSDNQQGAMAGNVVAGYFLATFLGCRPREAPEETTKRFFDAAEGFINERVTDPEAKARYHVALLATLSDQTSVVRPTVFARQHLDLPDRNAFVQRLAEVDVPTTEFGKDTARVEARLRRTRLDFASGLVLSGPPDQFDRHVHITGEQGGRTKVEIDDRLTRVRG